MLWQPTRGILQPNQHWRRPQGSAAPSQVVTFDSAQTGADITLTNSDWTATKSANAGAWESSVVTAGKSSGKAYIEFVVEVVNDTAHILFGMTDNPAGTKGTLLTNAVNGFYVRITGGQSSGAGVTVDQAKEPTYTAVAGSVIGLHFDFDNGKAWSGHNNSYFADPGAGASPFATWTPSATWYPAVSIFNSTGNSVTVHTSPSTQAYSPATGFSSYGAD
jgi:hypothetical protein